MTDAAGGRKPDIVSEARLAELIAMIECDWHSSADGERKRRDTEAALRELQSLRAEVATLRALASRKPSEGWLPIDSAPMDGTGIWGGWFRGVFNEKQPWRHQGVTYWQDGEWMNPDDADSSYDEPTHWRPLPDAPADAPSAGVCGTCGGTTGFVMNRGTLDVCDDPWHDGNETQRCTTCNGSGGVVVGDSTDDAEFSDCPDCTGRVAASDAKETKETTL